jgi:TonB family protein
VTGSVSVLRILRRAEPLGDHAQPLGHHAQPLGHHAQPSGHHAQPSAEGVLLSGDVAVPFTCGLTRPRILLPASAITWTAATLQAVLLHERAHIRRRDLVTQAAAQMVACLWWFQPGVWLLRSRLRAESEFACDAEVLCAGLRPSDYASELLSIARKAVACQVPSSAIGILHSSRLEQRVESVLYPSTASISAKRIGVLTLTLVFAAFAASALTITRTNSHTTGGFVMKRALLSALLTSAGLSAATITGTVHDANGVIVPDAAVTLTNADNSAQLQANTNAEGKFSLNGSGAGDYILHIVKAGYGSVYCEFSLNAQSEIDSEFTMATEGSPAPDNATGSKAIRVGGTVAQNNLIHKVNPIYPMEAKQNRVQGSVEIRALISKDGIPQELRVISSPGDDISASALQAVRQWRYRPTLLNGNPVEISTTIICNYTLLP